METVNDAARFAQAAPVDGSGYGSGSGDGSGYGDGSGSGDGSGYPDDLWEAYAKAKAVIGETINHDPEA